jgi:hypothetical protein
VALFSGLCVCAVATAQVPATNGVPVAATAPITTPADRVDLPSFGISLPIPQGFVRGPDSAHSVCLLVPQDQLGRTPDRAIIVNLRPRQGKRLEQIARETAEASKMSVTRADAKWGGLDATELVAIAGAKVAASGGPRVQRTLMLDRDGFIFAINFAADGALADDQQVFDAVVQRTSWPPVKRAGAGLAARANTLFTVNGLRVDIPDPFRPDPDQKPRQPPTFVARDLPGRVIAARLVILPLRRVEKIQSMSDVKVELDRRVVPDWKPKVPLTWDDNPGPPATALSRSVLTEDGWMRALIVLAEDGTPTVFSLHCRDNMEATAGFERTLHLVRASVESPREPAR